MIYTVLVCLPTRCFCTDMCCRQSLERQLSGSISEAVFLEAIGNDCKHSCTSPRRLLSLHHYTQYRTSTFLEVLLTTRSIIHQSLQQHPVYRTFTQHNALLQAPQIMCMEIQGVFARAAGATANRLLLHVLDQYSENGLRGLQESTVTSSTKNLPLLKPY